MIACQEVVSGVHVQGIATDADGKGLLDGFLAAQSLSFTLCLEAYRILS